MVVGSDCNRCGGCRTVGYNGTCRRCTPVSLVNPCGTKIRNPEQSSFLPLMEADIIYRARLAIYYSVDDRPEIMSWNALREAVERYELMVPSVDPKRSISTTKKELIEAIQKTPILGEYGSNTSIDSSDADRIAESILATLSVSDTACENADPSGPK